VVVLMGSGCETACEAVDGLIARGEAVGVLKVRLFRPMAMERLVAALPATVRAIAVLDRCKEPGSAGEPLYLDVLAAIWEHWSGAKPQVVGGRYGLASKEFTPAMVKAVLDNLEATPPRNHFTVGITDDVTLLSLAVDSSFDNAVSQSEGPQTFGAIFFGLGSDGTVSANKSSIKIIGEATGLQTQGYFVYDSKKAGSITVSHLRFGPQPIRSAYLIRQAQLVACHHWDFLEQFDLLESAAAHGTLLLNSPWPLEQSWSQLPGRIQRAIEAKGLQVFAVNASSIARAHGLGPSINTVMQACFFALAEVMPMAQALAAMGAAIEHSYAKKGRHIVASNLAAIEAAIAGLREITPTQLGTTTPDSGEALGIPGPWEGAPTAVRELVLPQLQRRGDQLPVSALPCDGSFASGTSQWEKRNIAETIPIWEPDLCVQCGKCVMVCPHAVIRAKTVEPELLLGAPEGFRSTPAHDPAWEGQGFTIQVAAEDCTGCSLCVEVCPARDHSNPRRKALNMAPQRPLRQQSSSHWNFFLLLPDPDRRQLNRHHVAQQQLQQPLFEFSGACAGCGETPYLKLASQLFGDRMVIANATGCSSIYGGNLPTTPWTTNPQGRGPAWSNSLFEDNAEFGLGFRIAFDQRRARAEQLLRQLSQPSQDSLPCPGLTDPFIQALIEADQSDEAGIHEQRQRVEALNQLLCRQLDHNQLGDTNTGDTNSWARELLELGADLVKRSVWIVGGDGWAYDIGFGGIDHLLASNHNVNLLVLDTEVYSNTGGQMSKATPKGAVAKFASGGKTTAKKDLGLMAMTYGSAYVASVAMGARDEHTLRVFLEAESFPGPSLILAYSHCIAHGIDMAKGMHQQRQAVACGRWLLYRHDPRRRAQGLPALVLDSAPPSLGLEEAMAGENRFRMLQYSHPEQARSLTKQAQGELNERFALYQRLATTPPAPGR